MCGRRRSRWQERNRGGRATVSTVARAIARVCRRPLLAGLRFAAAAAGRGSNGLSAAVPVGAAGVLRRVILVRHFIARIIPKRLAPQGAHVAAKLEDLS